jgi:hypothetical protein
MAGIWQSSPADRPRTSADQALQFRAAGFHRALAKKKPTQQKSPFWAPPTDRAEGTLSVQIGGTACVLSDVFITQRDANCRRNPAHGWLTHPGGRLRVPGSLVGAKWGAIVA